MRKAMIAIAVIVIIFLAWLAFGNQGDNTKTNQTTSNNTNTRPAANQTDQSDQAKTQSTATNEVEIEDMAFKPSNITVKKGTTVTWTNKDALAHTVTQDDSGGPGLDSKLLAKGEPYQATFNQTGTFHYHCTPHPQMTGTVTVTE